MFRARTLNCFRPLEVVRHTRRSFTASGSTFGDRARTTLETGVDNVNATSATSANNDAAILKFALIIQASFSSCPPEKIRVVRPNAELIR